MSTELETTYEPDEPDPASNAERALKGNPADEYLALIATAATYESFEMLECR